MGAAHPALPRVALKRVRTSGRASKPLVRAVQRGLAERACAANGEAMQRYMKSAMPCRGVKTPELRAFCRDTFARHALPTYAAWRDTVLALWREAEFREERYAAIELTGARAYEPYATRMESLPIYEEMIVGGAWWDLVDPLASHRLGALLARHPAKTKPRMRAWSKGRDLWKRRSAILCQLSFKERTDLALLYECIERAAGDEEFFLRKAIGWALRQYAWTDPDEVERYVKAHERDLSPLSKREALKSLAKARARRRGRRQRS